MRKKRSWVYGDVHAASFPLTSTLSYLLVLSKTTATITYGQLGVGEALRSGTELVQGSLSGGLSNKPENLSLPISQAKILGTPLILPFPHP